MEEPEFVWKLTESRVVAFGYKHLKIKQLENDNKCQAEYRSCRSMITEEQHLDLFGINSIICLTLCLF